MLRNFGKLNETLVNFLVDAYMQHPEVRARVDGLVADNAPDEIKRMGVIRKVQWLLQEFDSTELVRAHLAKQKEG